MNLKLKVSSWKNLIGCIRAQDPTIKTEGNFWAAILSLIFCWAGGKNG